MIITKKCTICGKRLLPVGMANHILNMAEGEAYIRMMNLLDYNPKSIGSISRAVMLRNMPHLGFVRRNMKNQKKKFVIP